MPEQRSKDKKFIGAWVPMGIAAGVETWLKRPAQKEAQKDRTDFLIEASLALLNEAGIKVIIPVEYSVGRPRKKLPAEAYAMVSETGDLVSSSSGGVGGEGKPAILKSVSDYLEKPGSKVPPSGKARRKAKVAHPPAKPPASSGSQS